MSSQDNAVRHQVIVPDKVPTGEYPVRQLHPVRLRHGSRPLTIGSSSTMTRPPVPRPRPNAHAENLCTDILNV